MGETMTIVMVIRIEVGVCCVTKEAILSAETLLAFTNEARNLPDSNRYITSIEGYRALIGYINQCV